MTSSALFLLLLLLIVPLRLVTALPVIFDHYVLALTWPNSYCRIEQCLHPEQKNLPQVFTIHGLWPSLSNGSSPPNCPKLPFGFNIIGKVIKADATQKWPDIRYSFQRKTKTADNEAFWTGQWMKHGVCSNLAPDNYLDVAMKLYDKVSTGINSAMKSHPNGGTVDILDFTAEIEKLVKIKPRLVCKNTVNPKGQLLSEIHFRVDKSAELIDAVNNSNCDPQVQFP